MISAVIPAACGEALDTILRGSTVPEPVEGHSRCVRWKRAPPTEFAEYRGQGQLVLLSIQSCAAGPLEVR